MVKLPVFIVNTHFHSKKKHFHSKNPHFHSKKPHFHSKNTLFHSKITAKSHCHPLCGHIMVRNDPIVPAMDRLSATVATARQPAHNASVHVATATATAGQLVCCVVMIG
jgi:hypothetical protein